MMVSANKRKGVFKLAVDRKAVGRKSRNKGKRLEREWVKFCREQGFEKARRSQQYAGGVDSADVINLPGLHQEVKGRHSISVEDIRLFLAQAIRDSSNSNNIPIVAFKEDYKKWFVAMTWDGFVTMYNVAMQPCIDNSNQVKVERFLDNTVNFVIIPAEDWFKIYREFYKNLAESPRL